MTEIFTSSIEVADAGNLLRFYARGSFDESEPLTQDNITVLDFGLIDVRFLFEGYEYPVEIGADSIEQFEQAAWKKYDFVIRRCLMREFYGDPLWTRGLVDLAR